jgi:hypothetical protein
MSDTNDLRERLLDIESEDPALRAEYERRLNAMLEIPLSNTRRVFLWAVLLGAVGSLALFAALLATETIPFKIRAVFIVGIVFAGCWIAYIIRILRHGTYRLKSDPRIAAVLGWLFTIITAMAFAMLSPHKDPFVMFGFLFLIPAAVMLLATQTQQAELRTQEKLLELEYRIARLAEGTEKPK